MKISEKIKELFREGLIYFFEKFSPLFSSETFPLWKWRAIIFIQLVFNFYLMWRKNSDHSKEVLMTVKMVSWLIISCHAFPRVPTDHQHGRASQQKPGASLKGLVYGRLTGGWAMPWTKKKKHEHRRLQLEAPLETGEK